MTRDRLLLTLTVLGFAIPNVMVIAFLAEHGLALDTYFGDWVGSLPAAQLTVDLLICCVAFLTWASWDGPRSGVGRWWLAIPATFMVGLCFGIPLYLLQRERALRTVT